VERGTDGDDAGITLPFFNFNGQFYLQTDGGALGSPLSPDSANFFMEHFEKMALERATHKPLCWFCSMDDRFIIWALSRQAV
jgi:hypothetical protein